MLTPKPPQIVTNSGEVGQRPSNPFIDALNKYKELIAVIVFFIGGVSWLYGYFATKEQVSVMKCLMNANIEFVQYQLQQKLALDERRQEDAQHLRLETAPTRTPEDVLNMRELEQQIALAKKRAEDALSKIDEAEHILQSDACEERETKPAPQSPEK